MSVFSSTGGQDVNHDPGFPRHDTNEDDSNLFDTIGQFTLTPLWSAHNAVLQCIADHTDLSTPLVHSVTIDVKGNMDCFKATVIQKECLFSELTHYL